MAEAGSGKSYEFRAQVDRLAQLRRFAFYLRVERLCDGSLDTAFETAAQESEFRKWKAGGDDAVFFLDSVDEAKLPKGEKSEPLRDALNTLERYIGPALPRCRIVVSCRGSEWYGETEQIHLASFASRMGALLPERGDDTDSPKLQRNLSFASLDRGQVELLTAAQGEPQRFLEFIEEHQQWDEVRTPMDVVHFATAYFSLSSDAEKAAKLSSRTAIFDASVRRRLADRPDSRSRLEMLPDVALRASQYLAFATTVMQVRDISFDAPVAGAIDVRLLFEAGPVSLAPVQRRQLLATPLFTPAGQGTVRFYRPEVEAILAAQFLQSLANHLPVNAIMDAFSSESFGISFVAQPYGPMLAWLAAIDPLVRRWLSRVAPEFLIEEGDPRALAIGDRVAALEYHVDTTHRNLPGSFYFPNAALTRFAEPDLENPVVRLLMAGPAREAKLHLLQIVRMGKYASAADWLEQVCGDGFTPSDVRAYAMRALIACGSNDHLRRVCETMLAWGPPQFKHGISDHISHREDDARIHLAAAAYPAAIDLETMLRLLGQVTGREFALDAEIFVVLSENAPQADLLRLIDGLERLCWTSRPSNHFSHHAPEQTTRTSLLFDGLCAAIARGIEEFPDAVRIESIDWCFTASRYSRLDRDREEWGRMSEALSKSPAVRQQLIIAAVNATQAHHPLIGLHEMMQLAWTKNPAALSADIDFALLSYANSAVEHRELWTDLLMRWIGPVSSMQHRKLCFQLGWAALRQKSGVDWHSLKVVRWRPFGWLRRIWYRYTYNDWWHIRFKAKSIVRDAQDRLAWRWALLRDWRKLNNGTRPFLAIHFIFGDRDEKMTRAEMIQRHGRLFGRTLVNAACRWVAQISPDIFYRSEIRRLNDAGLGWLHESDADYSQSLPEPVRLAAIQQDIWESDESPAWADALADSDQKFWVKSVESVVIAELTKRAPYEPEHSNPPLWKLHRFSDARRSLVAPAILAWAECNTTMCRADIVPLADIVQSDPNLLDRLCSLARRGTLEAFYEGQWRRGLKWIEIWGRYDVEAVHCLVDWLENVWRGNPDCEFFALNAIGKLLGGRWNRTEATLVDLPASLRLRLANLVHDLVRLADGEPSKEGTQTVTPRREMEDVRRSVENYLGADYSAAGREALVAFVSARIAPSHPEWAERWLASHARSAKQPTAWSVENLSQFALKGTLAPTNGDGLLARVTAEIDAICCGLNVSEFDRRALFNTSTDESDFRAWLGHELDVRIRGWASITQETVTRAEKRTDLRIELKGGDHAVLVIEIKLAHRWNRDVLLDKVKSQLVDQYPIGDHRVRHGLYLLVDIGLPLKGSLVDGTKPDLVEFVNLLSSRADEHCVDGVQAVKAQAFSIAK
ncbi:MAG: hypothetical protein J0M19_02910 [Sphingomonadales bacterium]|nr:hypothetical protein [Sphingomonadales bacterium]